MNISEFFINEEGRLRSGWRFIIFLLALFLMLGVLGGIVGAILYYFPLGFSQEGLVGFVIPNLILLFASLFVGWLCLRFLEDLPFRALGAWFTQNWLKDLGSGLLIGAASIGFAALLTVIFGATHFEFNRTAGETAILITLGVSLIIFTVGAAAEEALFRGYILQTFTRANLSWFAIALTSLFFASAHLNNPSVNYIAMLNTVLAGIWFSLAYLKTRTLWLAFGLHLAWNWVQGAFFGIPVSGIKEITVAPIFLPINSGSIILSGGDYGIEGGIACTISLILFIVLTWFLPIFKPAEEMVTLTGTEKLINE